MAEDIAIRNKDKFYRGKNVEDLKKLDVREFAKLVKARPRRAILRNFDVIDQFIQKCIILTSQKKAIRTHDRDMVIVPAFVGLTIHIHNGNNFLPVKIMEEMLGHRLGEFAMTRKPVKHGAAGVGATKSSSSLSVK